MGPWWHTQLMKGGQFSLKELKLNDKDQREGILKLESSIIMEFENESSLPGIVPYIYCVPTSNNFPTVDSFMLIPTSNFNFDGHAISSSASASSSFTLVGFQMAAREEAKNAPPNHGYHVSGIEKLSKLIAEKIKPPFANIQLRLILVLGDNFDKAKFQSIHDGNNAVSYTHLTLPTICSV